MTYYVPAMKYRLKLHGYGFATELNDKGELIGIEILGASTFIRDSVLESVQAKVLDLTEAKVA